MLSLCLPQLTVTVNGKVALADPEVALRVSVAVPAGVPDVGVGVGVGFVFVPLPLAVLPAQPAKLSNSSASSAKLGFNLQSKRHDQSIKIKNAKPTEKII